MIGFQIYFVVAVIILLSKFMFSICTFNRLKLFVSENRNRIDNRIDKGLLDYSDLVLYHFSSKSLNYSDYSKEMNKFLIQGTFGEVMLYFIFALFWGVSVPCVLICILLGGLETILEKFFKSILS